MVSKKTKLNIVIMAVLLSLTGCGGGAKDALVPARYISEYEVERNTVTVKKGDLTPFFEGELLLKDYDEVTYRIEGKWLEQVLETDDVIFDAVYKNVGDSVKAGETLLSFKSESLSKYIKETLSPRERLIIRLRYGLDGTEPLTQREVASMLKISRSYVSRIEKRALAALKKRYEEK